jgi:hypothetical protein
MGSFREGDDTPPPDGGGLPDLPPEWGVVVIPDDPSELDRESVQFRREQRRSVRRARWRRRFGMAPRSGRDDDNPPVGTPLLIMAIAIVAALTSLFAITLSTRTNSGTNTTPAPSAPVAPPQMVDLTLQTATGSQVNLRQTLPAVMLLLDGCPCDQLIRDTVSAAPAKVAVIIVDRAAPALPPGVRATALADPQQVLMATYGTGPDRNTRPAGQVTAVLVDSKGNIVGTANQATSVSDFKRGLTSLGQ